MIGTTFNLYDQSTITELVQVEEYDDSPVILTAIASSKGTEDFFDLKGQEYLEMFGPANFKAYGQSSIQNQRMIEEGARLVGKRIVADDAALANIVIVANVYKTEVQKQNSDGELLFYDSTMQEVTEDTGEPVMLSTAHVRYEAVSSTGSKNLEHVVEVARENLDAEGTETDGNTVFTYPLFVIADNGRCDSRKRFSIVSDTNLSKNLPFMFYTLRIIEDGNALQSIRFSPVPDITYRGESIELTQLSNTYLTQVKAHSFSEYMAQFIEKVSEFSLIEAEELEAGDILFGANIKGAKYKSIEIDLDNGIDLSVSTGIALVNGTNGLFGDNPFEDEAALALFNTKLLEFFDGTDTDLIYNLDEYQIDAVFDANYPANVKEAIVKLADYRGDFMFYRDRGLTCYTMDDVVAASSGLTKSFKVTDYCQAYDILDPYSKKNCKVTILYTISRLMVGHLKNRRNMPFAGIANDAIITDAVKGTLTFAPKITPLINEKSELEDLKINFASYFRDRLVLESLYTSQDKHTQLSYSNNVLALQRIFKTLRTLFPAIRYQFISNEKDLDDYTYRVNEALTAYASDFEELSFAYVADPTMLANKIFKATLTFRFKEFAQAEIIDAYILPTEPAIN